MERPFIGYGFVGAGRVSRLVWPGVKRTQIAPVLLVIGSAGCDSRNQRSGAASPSVPTSSAANDVVQTQSRAFLVGQLTECFLLEQRGFVNVMGVRFTPAGTSAFMPFDLSDIQDEEVTVEELWRARGRSLQDAVINANSDDDRVRIVESFLLGQFSGSDFDDRLEEAVRIIQSNQAGTVARISERVGWCERQLERQFMRKIGMSPKALLRTVRFQNLLQLARSGAAPGWASLAVDCGFSDQAHLIREFKRFSGEPPEMFLRRDHALYEFFATHD